MFLEHDIYINCNNSRTISTGDLDINQVDY